MTYYETDGGAKVFAAGAFCLANRSAPWPRLLDNLWSGSPGRDAAHAHRVASLAFAVLLAGPATVRAALQLATPRIYLHAPPGASHLPATARRGLIGHLEQYPDVSLATPSQRARPGRILDPESAVRRALDDARGGEARRLRDADGASEGGRRHRALPPRREAAPSVAAGRCSTRVRPKALIFARQPGEPAVLVGVMYSVQRGRARAVAGGPITRWHSHVVCTVGNKRGRRPQDDGTCPPARGRSRAAR
jgi:hypothetical protein